MILNRRTANSIIAVAMAFVLLLTTTLSVVFLGGGDTRVIVNAVGSVVFPGGPVQLSAAQTQHDFGLPAIERIRGDVFIQHVQMDGARGVLNEGDLVQTGATGAMHLAFSGASVVIAPNSKVELSRVVSQNGALDVELNLLDGSMFADVYQPLENGERFYLRTPASVVEVLGTSVHISHDAVTGISEVGLLKGSIAVTCLESGQTASHIVLYGESGLLVRVSECGGFDVLETSVLVLENIPAAQLAYVLPNSSELIESLINDIMQVTIQQNENAEVAVGPEIFPSDFWNAVVSEPVHQQEQEPAHRPDSVPVQNLEPEIEPETGLTQEVPMLTEPDVGGVSDNDGSDGGEPSGDIAYNNGIGNSEDTTDNNDSIGGDSGNNSDVAPGNSDGDNTGNGNDNNGGTDPGNGSDNNGGTDPGSGSDNNGGTGPGSGSDNNGGTGPGSGSDNNGGTGPDNGNNGSNLCENCRAHPCECPILCENCHAYPCECLVLCENCHAYQCECLVLCESCHAYPCECLALCENCHAYPCECLALCENCHAYPCECPSLCENCHAYPCECLALCESCHAYPCECGEGGGIIPNPDRRLLTSYEYNISYRILPTHGNRIFRSIILENTSERILHEWEMEFDISAGHTIRVIALDGIPVHVQHEGTRVVISATRDLQPNESVDIIVEAIRMQGNVFALQLTGFSMYSIKCSKLLQPIPEPIEELITYLLQLAERPGDMLVAIVDILSALIDFANEHRSGDLMGLLLEIDNLLEQIMPDGADPDSSGARLIYNIKYLIEILTPALPQEPGEKIECEYPYEVECEQPYEVECEHPYEQECYPVEVLPPCTSDREDVVDDNLIYTPDYGNNTDIGCPPYIPECEYITIPDPPYTPECDGLIIGDPPYYTPGYHERDYTTDDTNDVVISENTSDDTAATEITEVMKDHSDEMVVKEEEDITGFN